MAVTRQTRPRGPHAAAVTSSAPGRSCSVCLTSNEPLGRVDLAMPFQAILRSCTSATRQTTPARLWSTSKRNSMPSPLRLSLSFETPPLATGSGGVHLAGAVRCECQDGWSGKERQDADAEKEHDQAAVDREQSQAGHTVQSGEPPLRPQRDFGRIAYDSRSPRSPCRSTQRIAWTRSVTPIWRKIFVRCDLTVFSLMPSRRRSACSASRPRAVRAPRARAARSRRAGRARSLPPRASARPADRAASRPRPRCGCRAAPPPRRRP